MCPVREGQTEADVLVVDDDRDLRDTLAAVLRHEGYDVSCAENGAHALAMMHDAKPRAIVLDLAMPVMSGWELLEALHADARLSGIPTLVLSSMRAPRGVMQLGKPVSLDDLVTTVGQLCRH
jgi:CheY-like chemotaxis protein